MTIPSSQLLIPWPTLEVRKTLYMNPDAEHLDTRKAAYLIWPSYLTTTADLVMCYMHLCYLWMMGTGPGEWFWSKQDHKFVMHSFLPHVYSLTLLLSLVQSLGLGFDQDQAWKYKPLGKDNKAIFLEEFTFCLNYSILVCCHTA